MFVEDSDLSIDYRDLSIKDHDLPEASRDASIQDNDLFVENDDPPKKGQ